MGSIFDIFYILFESDTKKVEEGAKKAEQVTDSLNKKLSATETVGNKLGASFNKLVKQAAGAFAAYLSVGAVLGGIKAASDYANKLDDLSKALGVNVRELSMWSDAVAKKGGTAEGFQNTLQSMTAALTDFAVKGKSRVEPFFKELGIRMTDSRGKARDFLDILPELAGQFEKLSKSESFGLGQKLGLDGGTIMLLQSGRREVDLLIARQKELGVVTERDAEIAAVFNTQWADTAHAFRSVFLALNANILPVFTRVLKLFEDLAVFMRKEGDLIEGGIIAIAAAITAYLTPALIGLLISSAPIIGVIALITALVAAFALGYEDFKKYKAGYASLRGELEKSSPALAKFIKSSEATSKFLLKTFLSIPAAIKWAWVNTFAVIQETIDSFLANLDKILNFLAKIKSFFGGIPAKMTAELLTGNTAMAGFNRAAPLTYLTNTSMATANNGGDKISNVKTGPITINTQATDADGIAQAFTNSLETQIKQVLVNFDDGVLA